MAEFSFDQMLTLIRSLVEDGILGPEECPEFSMTRGIVWSWTILRPDSIPMSLQKHVSAGRVWL